RPYLTKENPEEVCAAIDALAKLDSEYLCIYLPQLMQNKNGKIRMNATRAFVGIDRDQIKSLVSSLLLSNSARQRVLGIPAAMLVDFGLVREPLLKAFNSETMPELIDKIGYILCSNPDREILHSVYLSTHASTGPIAEQKHQIMTQVAEKLSIALDKLSTPEELVASEEAASSSSPHKAEPASPDELKPGKPDSSQEDDLEKNAADVRQKIAKALQAEPIGSDARRIDDEREKKEHRAKMTVFVWILVAIVWGAMIVSLLSRFVFGS
ncbi:MAG TPA: hypothetical protein PKM25_19105, partial [Candidatus Ozemobacteraceae bacterium]|nr:hypothetical protein [Candidatus Ozemobacteraceae bacterium]